MVMQEDEYLELTKDPVKFMQNAIFPRKYELIRQEMDFNEKYKRFATAVDKLFTFMSLGKKNTQRLNDEHGVLVNRGASMAMPRICCLTI